jgi:putative transposase
MMAYRTIRLHLVTTPEQDDVLAETLESTRRCFNAVAAYGWEHLVKNGVELHKTTYYELRWAYPSLPADLLMQARIKAAEALRSAFTMGEEGAQHQPAL